MQCPGQKKLETEGRERRALSRLRCAGGTYRKRHVQAEEAAGMLEANVAEQPPLRHAPYSR